MSELLDRGDVGTSPFGALVLHWRAVAIGNPALWTYVRITHPRSHKLASLYLARTGTATLLEVDIQIRSRHLYKDWVETGNRVTQTNYLSRVFDLLTTCGAGASRWKSLIVRAEKPEALFKAIELLTSKSAPALCYLSLCWKSRSPDLSYENQSMAYFRLIGNPDSLYAPPLPNLRHVEFTAVPWGFVLEETFPPQALPLLTGLTRLELTSANHISNLSALRELLLSNPQLESLVLDSQLARRDNWGEPVVRSVSLSSLRSLSVGSQHPRWILDVIQMINAPFLEKFSFASVLSDHEGALDILDYIATGMPPDEDVGRSLGPIYPILREIDITAIKSLNGILVGELSLIFSLTRLSIRGSQIETLRNMTPRSLPKLVSLKFPYSIPPGPELGAFLRQRAEAGFPIQVVEFPANMWEDVVGDELPSTVTVLEHYDDELYDGYDSYEEEHLSDIDDGSDDDDDDFGGSEWLGGPGEYAANAGGGEGEELVEFVPWIGVVEGGIDGLGEGLEVHD